MTSARSGRMKATIRENELEGNPKARYGSADISGTGILPVRFNCCRRTETHGRDARATTLVATWPRCAVSRICNPPGWANLNASAVSKGCRMQFGDTATSVRILLEQ